MKIEVNVIIFGLGAMGKLIAKGVLEKKGLRIVGAVDVLEDIVGRDLGEVLEIGKNLGVVAT